VLRCKLKRWCISEVPEGILARRASKRLGRALGLVPVKVVFVLFRTWFNGWCSARRFQVKQAPCLFGCEFGSAEGCHDSIEHYMRCPVVANFALQRLRLPQTSVRSMVAFMCLGANIDDELLTLQLLLVYAIYSATNCLRFAKPAIDNLDEFLLQFVHQGASQSNHAQRVVHQVVTAQGFARRRRRA
jgi:hypothetical protein